MSIALQTRVRADVPELQSIVFVVEVGVGDEGEERHCDLKLQYPCKATPKMTFFAKMLYKSHTINSKALKNDLKYL